MKLAHSIHLRIFCYEKNNEDVDYILTSLKELIPFDLEKEKISVEKTNATGFLEKTITILEIHLDKDRHVNGFLELLKSTLDRKEKGKILDSASLRLDDDLNFYLRFDKRDFLKSRELKLTDSGDCLHLRMLIAAYPKKKDKALDVLRDIFG